VATLSLHRIRLNTAWRCSSNAGVSTSVNPALAQWERTEFGVSSEFDQLTVLPPPTVLPAAMLTMPSADGKNPPRRKSF
jgi:hypothetical protein